MNLYDTIRTRLGITNPNDLLDERVYSREELEKDLVDLDWDLQDMKEEINELNDLYHEKLQEANEAPAWEEDLMFEDADLIEQDREDLIAVYHDRHDLKRMLKSIKSTRRRVKRNSLDLNVEEPLSSADRREVGRVLKQELRKKGLNDDKVQEVTDMLTKARDRGNERSGRKKRNIQKHKDRADSLNETPEDEHPDFLGDADQDRNPNRTRDRDEARASATARVRRD